MKQRNVIILLLVIGGLFWCKNLNFSRTLSHPCCESCDLPRGHSGVSDDRKFKNETLLLELEQERHKNSQLEKELSRLQGQKQNKPQRIALMFTGAPRTLTQLGVMTSHVVNVIDALSAGGTDVIDVFFHLNNGTADGVHASQNQRRVSQKPFTQEMLDRLINLTSPVEVVLHTDSSCSGLDGRIANHSCCTHAWPPTDKPWLHNFLQFAFVRESYRRVKQYEEAHNIKYDWFVRTRPDVACFEPMPAARSLSTRRIYLLTKERELGGNTNDYIFVVPSILSFSFFEEQIMTLFETNCPKGISGWPAEGKMFNHSPHLPYQVFPFPCVHVLSPTAAECFRLSRHRQMAIPSVYDVDGSKFSPGQSFEEGCNTLVENGYFGDHTYIDGEELGNTWR